MSDLIAPVTIRDTVVSTINSSTATLGVSGTFTGAYEDLLAYSWISVFSESNSGTSTVGVEFQWSHDGVGTAIVQSFEGTQPDRLITAPVVARYFRIKYNNGGNAQTRFSLQTLFHRTGSAPPAVYDLGTTSNTASASELHAQLVAAVLYGVDAGSGNIREVRLDSNGDIRVSVSGQPISVELTAGTANIGDVGILTVPGPLSTTGGGTEAAALRVTLATDSTGLVSVDDNGGSLTVDGNVTANPATSFGKTMTFVPVNQTGVGTTVLAAADVTRKHKLLGGFLTLGIVGTLRFTDGVADLNGPMDIARADGMVFPTSIIPYTETGAVNRPLNLVTTGGPARGCVVILTEA